MKIYNVSEYGWEHAVRGMRRSFNSQDKSDSNYCSGAWCSFCNMDEEECEKFSWDDPFIIGPKDMTLIKTLISAGTSHRKFMRMVDIWFDIEAPLLWWKQFDTYKVGTVRLSDSTMHTIMKRDEFLLSDFEHADNDLAMKELEGTIFSLNKFLNWYKDEEDQETKAKIVDAVRRLLPDSFIQGSTEKISYETLWKMEHERRNHRLEEWRMFLDQIEEGILYPQFVKTEEV